MVRIYYQCRDVGSAPGLGRSQYIAEQLDLNLESSGPHSRRSQLLTAELAGPPTLAKQ